MNLIKHYGVLMAMFLAILIPSQVFAEKERPEDRALFDAVKSGKLENVKQVLAKGADVNAKDPVEGYPLLYYAIFKSKEIVDYLISNGADLNARVAGWNLLAFAVENSNKEVVELLIAKGLDVNDKQDHTRKTILMESMSRRGKDIMEILELLIRKGADVNAKDADGKTPLMYAAVYYGKDKDVFELLVSKGADINAQDRFGNTVLMNAIIWYKTKIEIVEFLISKDADVNAKSNLGETALMIAAQNGKKEFVELLLSKDADVNAKNDKGKTALDSALIYKKQEIADLLRSKMKN